MRSFALCMVALVLGMAYALGVGFARALVLWLETNPMGGM
jgi:hypothetical protein